MRKFYIEDHKGERIPLNNENGIFLYNPSGLGLEYSNDYADSESGFFMRTRDKVSQSETSFTLVFPPKVYCTSEYEPYERYRKFLDWLYAAEELFLIYRPYGIDAFDPSDAYYKKIDLQSIEKTELDKYGSLQPTVSVLPLTPWYLPAPININFGEDDETAMRYTFEYNEDLHYGVGSQDYTAEITAKGHIPSAVKVTFRGEATNPRIILRGTASRKVYGECDVTATFLATDTLVFSTAEQDSYIKKIDSDGNEVDLLDSIDITKNPFFRVPITEPCELTISGDTIFGDASMLLYVYYRGV